MFRAYYGPGMYAYAAAEANGRTEELHQELTTRFPSPNAEATSIPATLLQVSVTF